MMKIIYAIFTTIVLLLAAHNSSARELASEGVTCEYQSGNIQFKTTGSTKNEAREKASHMCFDRHMALLDQRGAGSDEEQELMIMDECVNICD